LTCALVVAPDSNDFLATKTGILLS
jgi:hypothetical protein